MIYIIFIMTLSFLAANYLIAKKDFFNPGVIFCGVFTISEILCILFQKEYEITFHYKTLIVLLLGFSVFTGLNYLFAKKKADHDAKPGAPARIVISDKVFYIFIALQVIAIIAFIVYLYRISAAYDGKARSLGEMINLYDTMTKFWRKKFIKLDVPIPMAYRVLNPFVYLGGYLSVYVLVNNWFAEHRIDKRSVISVVLLIVLIMLNGSRSPVLRIITMVIILAYIIGYRSGAIQIGNIKNLKKILLYGVLAVAVLILMVKVIRPEKNIGDLGDYLFIYSGAPLVNLNTFLVKFSGWPSGRFFGEQTFRYLYNYIGKWLGIKKLETYDSINAFAFSANGKEIGNVYTCFYYLLFDFGYIGMPVMIGIMAYYYFREYHRSMTAETLGALDLRLFIYAYLFNDLVMSFFSTRFYETTCSPEFLKMCAVLLLGKYILKRRHAAITADTTGAD